MTWYNNIISKLKGDYILMSKKTKNILNNPWLIAIFAPLIGGAIPTIWISITKKINIKDSLGIVFDFIKNILNYKVPIWGIIGIILSLILILIIIDKITSKPSNLRKYSDWYYDFRGMDYKDWSFSWDYTTYANTYTIKELKPICSCSCNLIKKSRIGNIYYGTPALECPNCKKVYSSPDRDTIKEVESLIEYKIKNNSYTLNTSTI
jgi:hypothetical protein